MKVSIRHTYVTDLGTISQGIKPSACCGYYFFRVPFQKSLFTLDKCFSCDATSISIFKYRLSRTNDISNADDLSFDKFTISNLKSPLQLAGNETIPRVR